MFHFLNVLDCVRGSVQEAICRNICDCYNWFYSIERFIVLSLVPALVLLICSLLFLCNVMFISLCISVCVCLSVCTCFFAYVWYAFLQVLWSSAQSRKECEEQ